MDYGYPHPDDLTPPVQKMLEADGAMDAEREREALLAAAPDMLAALEGLVHSVLPANRRVAYANARAAIAKAKGETVPTAEVLA